MTLNDIILKVISAYVVIPTCSVSEIIYDDTSTETIIDNKKKKSYDSFQLIRLAIFQGHSTVSHQISRKRCVIWQKLLQSTDY